MALLLVQRLFQAAMILLGVAAITFGLLHYLPADPAALIAGRSANAEMIANVRHQLGLDLPLPKQFWNYLVALLHGDLGRSFVQRTDVTTLILSRIPATFYLMLAGIFVEVTIGLSAGVLAAVRRNSFTDSLVMTLSFVGVSAPQFVVALLLLYLFAVTLNWFPMGGYGTPSSYCSARTYLRSSRCWLVCPHCPLGDVGRSQPGLYPDRQCERTFENEGHLSPWLAECTPAFDCHDWD